MYSLSAFFEELFLFSKRFHYHYELCTILNAVKMHFSFSLTVSNINSLTIKEQMLFIIIILCSIANKDEKYIKAKTKQRKKKNIMRKQTTWTLNNYSILCVIPDYWQLCFDTVFRFIISYCILFFHFHFI